MIFPHGGIESISPDLFMVRGSIKLNAVLRISRNMGIIRHDGELSLINPIRLNLETENTLKQLGDVKRVIRLGAYHGFDDLYYVDTFGAQHWSQPGGTVYTEPTINHPITADCKLPFPDAELFLFKTTNEPECALLVERDEGILFTCDAIQHYGDYSFNNLPARLIMPFIGFPKTTVVGPIWLKGMTPEGESLESEFRELLNLHFDKLLSAHGTLLTSGAHESVERAVNKAFADS